jgi:N-sulfoglucosamine sulfohydrolase
MHIGKTLAPAARKETVSPRRIDGWNVDLLSDSLGCEYSSQDDTMKLLFLLSLTVSTLVAVPNVLFIIADDASKHYGKAYDCDWAKTPHIDSLTAKGLVFDNAYVPTSKCGPCRSALMTGRNPWQLGPAANHQAVFPPEHRVFGEELSAQGIACGAAGKTWGPGTALKDGKPRNFGLKPYSKRDFATFIADKKTDAPFFYWYGSNNPHRGYPKGAGLKKGKKLSDIDHVPAYWPDTDTIRGDMLDYATEIEAFDSEVGGLLEVLRETGHANNTIVIVTSDHGMPFPRVKGHTFDDAHRVPFIAFWPGQRESTGRIADVISLTDLAPTLFELFGLETDMGFSGESFADLLLGEAKKKRPYVIIGRERNDINTRPGYPSGGGYPARGIRMGDYLYVHNFKPERWPCGNPNAGMRDTDGSPTKTFINDLGQGNPFWEHNFGKRPMAQLFNVATDPDCVSNLAGTLPELQARLHSTLIAELTRQKDPRALGNGEVFDNYESRKKPAKKKKRKK